MISYDYFGKTDIGTILLAVGRKGLCGVMLGKAGPKSKVAALKRLFPSEKFRRDPEAIKVYKRDIVSYLEGSKKGFSFPMDLSSIKTPFTRRVLKACMKIPYGKTISYGQLAKETGSRDASRAVGNALSKNPIPIVIPCHRVVASTGKLGGFSGGVTLKRKLLSLEGIKIRKGRVVGGAFRAP